MPEEQDLLRLLLPVQVPRPAAAVAAVASAGPGEGVAPQLFP